MSTRPVRRGPWGHGTILTRIAANHVIYPETEADERAAQLLSGRLLDHIEFDDDSAIVGMTLPAAQVRKKYGITVLGVKAPGSAY